MSNLKDKLYNQEAIPPAHVWDKIAASLDEGEKSVGFAGRMYDLEIAAPAAAWSGIANALDEESGVINMRSRPRGSALVKYAAAAAIIGIIAFAIVRLAPGSNKTEIASKNIESPIQKDTPVAKAIQPIPPAIASNTEAADTEVRKSLVRVNTGNNGRRYLTAVTRGASVARNTNNNISQASYAYDAHVPSIAERYVVLMTPDGNFIRMAKKWGSLLCCVSGEEQDPDCKDQLKKWQEKIATSPIAPAPGNFMDILSLVNSLDDDAVL